jgi:epoxyqueuosine reductase
VVDARRCLSWLLQATGPFPREHRVALGDRIYGCDDCQEVCPPNRRDDRNERPDAGLAARARVDVFALLRDPDDMLLARHGRWYIPERDPRWLRRNALVVLANEPTARAGTGTALVVAEARRLLERYLAHDDTLLVAHAVWAARRLGHEDLLPAVAGHLDPLVRAELDAPIAP